MTREELLEALKSLRERLPYHDTASRLVIGEAIAALLARVSCTFCFAEDKSLMTCCKDCFKKLGRQAPCACEGREPIATLDGWMHNAALHRTNKKLRPGDIVSGSIHGRAGKDYSPVRVVILPAEEVGP